LLVLIMAALLAACGDSQTTTTPPSAAPPAPLPQLQLTAFVSGLASPVGLESARDRSGRLFALEQAGKIRIIRNSAIVATPFLDITPKVASGGELGLLGLAFHPAYASNRKFYVDYTRPAGSLWQTVIAEYLVSSTNPDLADPNSERILLIVNQPFSNHNGGQLAFGSDGFLYIALGDGGSGGDPLGNGQNKQALLGKILRVDVNSSTGGLPYGIPADNPFANSGGAPEVFAYGFRNPWRFSFDTAGGTLFAGDVGQDSFEEVDIVQKGLNYGWNTMEGTHCFSPSSGCNMAGLTLPINDYGRGQGATVIGGFVYRGSTTPALVGAYVFGDFISGRIWGLRQNSSGGWDRTQLAATGKAISSFGRDESNELYVVDYSGPVFKLAVQ
jgi:glucose/arabinose dehydrogenase